ncbi:zygote arrest protein 1 isoform X2 [Dromiciops gliroides]|uniref:zygote arrest protein 1 isoform X2 n=1 Tax=Dromiciops gliroides TaxID=33562 RepID=UPI001CC4DCB1|nr:zygote arrest protein 1 isoform X2 [Dromiciops gliroides]
MAALGDDGLDGYMYPPYSPYSYPYVPGPKGKGSGGGGGGGSWRPRATAAAAGAASAFSGYGQLTAAEYFDSYQRAQLMAILSQVNPGLVPRLRKANTRDVGVQVNPRQDASVQCSLGRRTLVRRGREPGALVLPTAASPPLPPALGSPATGALRPSRFPRTVAVYSPVASRRLATFVEETEAEAEAEAEAEGGGPEGKAAGYEARPPARESPEAGAAQAPRPQPQEGGGGPAQAAVRATWEEQPPRADGLKDGEPAEEPEEEEAEAEALQPQSPEESKTRLRFQFLEQKYGYYHCKDCNIRWESAYVWCVQGTNKVYFKQFCRTCQKSYNPYRVEDIACQSCKQTRCSCPVKLRHVDPKRPHRQDLCGRCKGKRLSCDSTFSFKYII